MMRGHSSWILALLGVLVMAAGCDSPSFSAGDQCLRREIFMQCLASVPKGPVHVHNSNDWDEVVNACESAAYYQSLRTALQIKPECRSGV